MLYLQWCYAKKLKYEHTVPMLIVINQITRIRKIKNKILTENIRNFFLRELLLILQNVRVSS